MASASSSDSPGSDGMQRCPFDLGPLVTVQGVPPSRAQVVPHSGYLHLDQVGFALTHETTQETRLITAASAELHWSEGWAALVTRDSNGLEDVKAVEDILRQRLYRDLESGGLFVVFANMPERQPMALDEVGARHKRAEVEWFIGAANASANMNACIMHRPRHAAQRIFWELGCLYSIMQMTSYCGVPSKWVFQRYTSWEKGFRDLGFRHDQIIFSTHIHDKATHRSGRPWLQRCLPFSAVSTLGLLILLCKWSFLARHLGGLDDGQPAQQRAAHELLLAFLAPVCAIGGAMWSFVVLVDRDYLCLWPRPPTASYFSDLPSAKITVNAGMVDLTLLRQLLARGARGASALWHKELDEMLGHTSHISLASLLEHLASRPKLKCLFAQFLFKIATELELRLGAASKIKGKAGNLIWRWENIAEAFSGSDMVHRLAQYVVGARQWLEGHRVFGFATDKATVCRLPLRNSFIVTPTGKAALCAPTVDAGFEVEAAVGQPKAGQKRLGQTLLEGAAKRQKAFVERHKPGVKADAYRPVKMHRTGARKWVSGVDMQLQVITGKAGLKAFAPDYEAEEWQTWDKWPYMCVCCDLGSDGLSGYQALERKHALNIDLMPDPHHGAHCDLKLALAQCQLYSFWLVCVCCWNLPFGPEKDEQRFLQIRDCIQKVHQGRRPTDLPLFQAYCSKILDDMKAMGIEGANGEWSEKDAFEFILSRSFAVREGRRISMGRFMASVEGAETHIPKWSVDAYETLTVALELDLLRSKTVQKIILRAGESENIGEHSNTTSAAQVTMDDRALRSCAENGIVIRTAVYLDEGNRRLAACICASASKLRKWHGAAAKQLRGVDGVGAFWAHQVTGGFMQHCAEMLDNLSSVEMLESCKFVLTKEQAKLLPTEEVKTEDEYAEIMAQLAVTLVACRCRRGLHYFGWPFRALRLLKAEYREQTMAELKRDYETWVQFQAKENMSGAQRKVESRSVFGKTSVMQVVAGAKECDFQASDRLVELLRQRSRVMMPTLACEELFAVQKSSKEVRTGRRFRRPEYSMGAALAHRVLEDRNKLSTPGLEIALTAKTERLAPESFKTMVPDKWPLDFNPIASVNAAPEWFSPSAQNSNMPHADLALLEEAKHEDFALVRTNTLGPVFDVRRKFVFREADSPKQSEWFLPLSHFSNGVILCWPVAEVTLSDGRHIRYDFAKNLKEPRLFVLKHDLRGYLAAPIVWRSWMWQCQNATSLGVVKPAILMFQLEKPENLLNICCRAAFFNLCRTSVVSIANAHAIDLDGRQTLCDVLAQVIAKVLETEEEQTLEFVSRRLHATDMAESFAPALLELDSLVEVLEKDDQQKVAEEQKGAKHLLQDKAAFLANYKERRAKVVERKGGGGGKRGKGTGAHKWTSSIDHGTAKQMLPPAKNCSVWRGLTRRQWCGHYPGTSRCSASWDGPGGEQGALKIVMRKMWRSHLDKFALPDSAAPQGLFDDMSLDAPSGAAASSSSSK